MSSETCYIIHPFRALYMFAFVWTWLVVLVNLFSSAFIVTESFLENINLDKTCIAAWLVDLFPHRLFVHFLWNGSKICFGMDPRSAGSKRDKQATLLTFDFHELDAWTSWNALADMFSIIESAHVAFVSEFPWEIFVFCFVGESCGSEKVSLRGGRGRGKEGTCQNVYSWSA